MRTGFAIGQNSFLVRLYQSNIAMPSTVDVHEHGPADKKGVFMDTGVLFLGYARQGENSLAQFLMNLIRLFGVCSKEIHAVFLSPTT